MKVIQSLQSSISLSVLCATILGCGTTALEQRAVIKYAQASSAFGDLLEDDFLSVFIGMMTLESTSIALKPEQHIERDQTITLKTLSDVRLAIRFYAHVLRTDGQVLVALLEGNRPFLNSYAKQLASVFKIFDARIPGALPFDSQQIKLLEEFDAAALSREELRDRVILHLSKDNPLAIDNWKSTIHSFEVAYAVWAITARDRSYSTMTDSDQNLITRLAASEKHVKAAQLSIALESFVEKHDTTLNEYSKATTEVLKALKDPHYTTEDLKALLVRLEELLKHIEQTASIAKRIAALLIVF